MLPKLSLCVNTYNEGPDLLATILSARQAYSGPFEAVIVADGTTDNSLENLPDYCRVIRNPKRFGCGKAKQQAVGAATGDVILHMDGHCRVLSGNLDGMVKKAATEECILAPGVAPLYCKPTEVPKMGDTGWAVYYHNAYHDMKLKYYKALGGPELQSRSIQLGAISGERSLTENEKSEKERIQREVSKVSAMSNKKAHRKLAKSYKGAHAPFYKPTHCSYGGTFTIDDEGLSVKPKWMPKEEYGLRETTWYACFMMSRKTCLERLGGWNTYPGTWGSQEKGIALRAAFAKVPIYAVRDVVFGHRYFDNEYHTRHHGGGYRDHGSERTANTIYAHQVVFQNETVESVFMPIWKRSLDPKRISDAMGRIDKDGLLENQRKDFQSRCKRLSDSDFLAAHKVPFVQGKPIDLAIEAPKGAPVEIISANAAPVAPTEILVPCGDITAIILNYKRPICTQKAVDALIAGGISNIWVWCQENAEPPRGSTRVIRDSGNSVTWGRYALASLVPTPWVLFCDDDCEVRPEALKALRRGGVLYPDRTVGVFGARFKGPKYKYRERHYYWSNKITEPTEVDILWPKGQLIPRNLAQELYGDADKWQYMRKSCNGITRGDDLIAFVINQMKGKPDAIVMPTKGQPLREHASEGKPFALYKQPEYRLKGRTLQHWLEIGYAPIAKRTQKEYNCTQKMNETNLLPEGPAEKPPTGLSSPDFEKAFKAYHEKVAHDFTPYKNKPILKQCVEELRQAWDRVAAIRPKAFLEVGSASGATLYIYAHACKPGAKIVSVDIGKRVPDRRYLKRTIELLKSEGYDVQWLRGSSHDPAIMGATRAVLNGAKPEFVHIDGDHGAKGAWQDWQDYAPMASRLVAVHDILFSDGAAEVWKVWPRIKEGRKVTEIAGPPVPWNKDRVLGIGLVEVKAA